MILSIRSTSFPSQARLCVGRCWLSLPEWLLDFGAPRKARMPARIAGQTEPMYRVWVNLLVTVLGIVSAAGAIEIQFDYSLDSPNPFFNSQEKRASLQAAAEFFNAVLTDDLDAILPDASQKKNWIANFFHPSTLQQHSQANLEVPADTLIIFVGGHDWPGGELGMGIQGLFEVTQSTPQWIGTLQTRGEPNATPGPNTLDYGPWGGALSLDTLDENGVTHVELRRRVQSRSKPIRPVLGCPARDWPHPGPGDSSLVEFPRDARSGCPSVRRTGQCGGARRTD